MNIKNEVATSSEVQRIRRFASRFTAAVLVTVGAAVVIASVHAAASKSAERLEAEKAVEHALEAWATGFRTRNAEIMAGPDVYYKNDASEDHYVLFDVIPPFVNIGSKEILKKNQDYFAATDGPTIAYWSDKHVDADGDLAFFRGIMHATGKYKDGRQIKMDIRHTLVLKKIDGKFVIIHEHASVPDHSMSIETPAGTPAKS